MNNKEIFQSYICEALRKYKIDCIEQGKKADENIVNLFVKIINEGFDDNNLS